MWYNNNVRGRERTALPKATLKIFIIRKVEKIMANEKKITKREKNELLIAVLNGRVPTAEEKDMLIEHITHENELLARKGSKSATLSPAQKDALAIAELIKDELAQCEDKRGMTVGALLKAEPIKSYVRHNGEGVSSQVITAIFTKNTVSDSNPNADFIRTVEKKVAYYSLNYGVEGEGEGE